ncbi:MAG: MarR family transcriptional regulator [bacterium]
MNNISDYEKTKLALNTWVKLARAFNTFNKAANEEISSYGLTTSQFGVLESLFHLGPMTIGKICDKILVTGGNMTVVLDNLEKQGLIKRVKTLNDRRALNIELTEKGEELIKSVFPKHERFITATMEILTNDEQKQLGLLLKKIGLNITNNKR